MGRETREGKGNKGIKQKRMKRKIEAALLELERGKDIKGKRGEGNKNKNMYKYKFSMTNMIIMYGNQGLIKTFFLKKEIYYTLLSSLLLILVPQKRLLPVPE